MDQVVAPIVDPKTLKTWLDRNDVVLIDVREQQEHAEERIPGAKLVPLSTFDPALLVDERDRVIVLHCVTGGRSARALSILAASGYSRLYNLKGGILAWKAAGLPIETGRW